MKTKSITIITLGLMLICPAIKIYAQNSNDSLQIQLIGLGLHMEQYKLNDLTSFNTPANKLILSINTLNRWRFEADFGFNSNTNKKTDLKSNVFLYGLGVYRMYQKRKTNIYGGVKVEYSKYTQEY